MNNKKEGNILRKSLMSSIVFIIIVILAFYFIFRETKIKTIYEIILNSNKLYILIAIVLMLFFSLSEALIIKMILKLFKEKVKFKDSYKYALCGYFVSCITPSSSGGDPMQLYWMSKDKIKVSHSAITLLVKLVSYQFVVITLAIISYFTSINFFNHELGIFKYFIYFGLIVNSFVLILYILMIFYKKIIMILVDLFCKLLNKVHYKKTDNLKESIYYQLEEYSRAANLLKHNKRVFLKVILVTFFELVSYFCIPYFIYLALGGSSTSIIKFISIQAVLHVSVSFLPFPGAVGISEATFLKLYKSLFTEELLAPAMIITRFVNFYLFVLYSGVMLLFFVLKTNLKKK